MQQPNGFTLVELIIVIALVGIMAAITAPLGLHWIAKAQIANVEGEIAVAVGKAKSAAIRNQFGALNNEPVAAICIDGNHNLTVLENTADAVASCSAGTGNEVWQASLDNNVVLTSNDVVVECLCFSGMAVLTNVNCNTCQTQNRLILTAGSNNETVLIN